MLRTFEPQFDFHFPEGGRPRFADFAAALSQRFGTSPQIVAEPIFTYNRYGRTLLDRLRVLDESRPAIVYLSNIVICYFAHVAVFGDQPFFLDADCNVDFHDCIKQLRNDARREYLLGQSIPFATLGDDHMDDEYAVSYGMDCWRFGDDGLAFAR